MLVFQSRPQAGFFLFSRRWTPMDADNYKNKNRQD